ncbi:hypothetical protein [Niallia sp. NCCP-28]|uniref:hypothetical protein n=1 Tax=Niallia sp. NCCP-28 TaxID=2934712 RepID=UPI0020850C4C|nr:hypothetical protein [Niallia sp. NCCP-28]GKU82633.1 hypothetical protein NCCP28_20290 [Niallia sp. NCCP-28]
MIGLLIAVALFNFLAIKLNKRLNANRVLHIWMFTSTFQLLFDMFVDFKYLGYWYFTKDIDWISILYTIFLVQPVNIIFLNYYPFKKGIVSKIMFIFGFNVVILLYENVTLLPEPWGYFHYGWWKIWYSALINPILLISLILYYHYIVSLEQKVIRYARIK